MTDDLRCQDNAMKRKANLTETNESEGKEKSFRSVVVKWQQMG